MYPRAEARRPEDAPPAPDIKLSNDPIRWASQVRVLRKEKFTFPDRPYLHQIIRDDAHEIIIRKGRQLEMSEWGLNLMLYYGWRYPGIIIQYVSDTQPHADKFSKLRFKKWGIDESKILQALIPKKNYTIRETEAANGSMYYFNSAWGEFGEVNSIPCDLLVIDEAHATDIESLESAKESLGHSRIKKLVAIGIGDYEDTPWYKYWMSGTQYAWDAESRSWQAKNPSADIHSYYISPHMAPWVVDADIERSWNDATSKLKWRIHYLGEFVEGIKKPITEKMLRACFDSNLSMVDPETEDMEKLRKNGPIFCGIDFGGGTRSHTIPWFAQLVDEDIPVVRLLYTRPLDYRDVEEQADRLIRLIELFEPELGVMDEGGGTRQLQKIENRFGELIHKCRYTTDQLRPIDTEKLWEENLVRANRTHSIDGVIDLLSRPHMYPKAQVPTPRYQIPYADPKKIDWMIPHFTSIYAKPMRLVSGQEYIKYDKEPDDVSDALHACNYNLIAINVWKRQRGMFPSVGTGTPGGG